MDYFTVVASTYEEAVANAKLEYGERVRIHSRRDVKKPGFLGLGKGTVCELTCFLTEEDEVEIPQSDNQLNIEEPKKDIKLPEKQEEVSKVEDDLPEDINVASLAMFEQAKKNVLGATSEEAPKVQSTEEPEVKEEQVKEEKKEEVKEDNSPMNKLLNHARHLLVINDFTDKYIDWLLSSIREILKAALPQVPTNDELEIMVLDKIAESLAIDTSFAQNPNRVVIVLGPASAGKTTMVAKLVAAFSSINSSVRRNVRVVLLDDSPAVVAQLQKLGKALNIGVAVAPHEAEMSEALNAQFNNELVFVDAVGRPLQNNNPDYRIFGLMNVANKQESKFLMTIPASMKNSDIQRVFVQYKTYPLSGLLVTKLDETCTVGNVISLCYEHDLPILYTSSGKKIPKDISKATSGAFLRLLQGFSIDINDVIDSEQ